MHKLSNWDHCCDHSLKIDCSRYTFDILFDDMHRRKPSQLTCAYTHNDVGLRRYLTDNRVERLAVLLSLKRNSVYFVLPHYDLSASESL